MGKQAQIVDLDRARLLKQVKTAYRTLQYVEGEEIKLRDLVAARRLELGELLMKARSLWPARGPRAKGWGDFLGEAGIDQDVALVAMKYAGYIEKHFPDKPGKLPTLHEAGLDNRPRKGELDAGDEDKQRDTWCTPKDIAEALGEWDLDPCSNPRSHIKATETRMLERGEDGLLHVNDANAATRGLKRPFEHVRTFINPPYSNVMPWVEGYKHTQFCFLLKFDPSTKWFAALFEHTRLVLFPRGTRIEFEPPPGIEGDSNQFPHALFYARADDATSAIKAMCLPGWWVRHPKA